MEEYKQAMKILKLKAKEYSIEDSNYCWKLFPGKKRAKYTECGQKSAIAYHVFCQGKRELKTLKKMRFEECINIYEPNLLYSCRNKVYQDLLLQVPSLEQWIERERLKFKSELS